MQPSVQRLFMYETLTSVPSCHRMYRCVSIGYASPRPMMNGMTGRARW